YGSLMYCGKLAKNTNCGIAVGNCIQYLIFMYLPLVAGGGLCSIIGNMVSLNFDVAMRCLRFSKTCTAASNAFSKRCLFSADTNKMGTSANGAICSRTFFSYSRAVMVSFSTNSHLLIKITTPLRFFSANQKIF